MDWKTKAMSLWREGKSWAQIVDALRDCFPGKQDSQIREIIRGYIRKQPEYIEANGKPMDIQQKAIGMLTKGTSLGALQEALGLSAKMADTLVEELRESGYNIVQIGDELKISNVIVPQENIVRNAWDGAQIIRFGVVSDTHLNSKYTQITHLHSLYDTFEAEGIDTVYHAGDIDEGEQMRPGHQYECYNQGADDHIAEIVRVYPERPGIKTKFITGNHDHSIIKRAGYDIGRALAAQRKDMEYLGQSSALVYLTPNCTMEIRHPLDGAAYSLSYKTQKAIDSMSGGEKPNIFITGHYHKAEYLFYRNVHSVQAGTTQAQTPFMRGKGLSAHMGGWIIEVHVHDDGTISRFKSEFIPFYRAIADDYKGWR